MIIAQWEQIEDPFILAQQPKRLETLPNIWAIDAPPPPTKCLHQLSLTRQSVLQRQSVNGEKTAKTLCVLNFWFGYVQRGGMLAKISSVERPAPPRFPAGAHHEFEKI